MKLKDMKNKILFWVFYLMVSLVVAQTQTTTVIKDMVIKESYIYAIEEKGTLRLWHTATLKEIPIAYDTQNVFTAIALDRKQNVVVGTKEGKLFYLSENGLQLFKQLKKPYTIQHIVFNSQNHPYLVIPNALYSPITDTYWTDFHHNYSPMIVQKRYLFFFKKRIKTFFLPPSLVFVDDNDLIWMTSFYGEFGGNLQLFDSKERKIINTPIENLELGLFFPQSIFTDGKTDAVYIASGIQHIISSGDIFKIQHNTAEKIFDGKDRPLDERLFIGASTIDAATETLYIATQKGIYQTPLPKSGRVTNIELLCNPQLYWEREPLAIGAKMAIKKLFFHNDKLFFLTAQNGIGVYHEGIINYLNKP